jgi:hypothetical protein
MNFTQAGYIGLLMVVGGLVGFVCLIIKTKNWESYNP